MDDTKEAQTHQRKRKWRRAIKRTVYTLVAAAIVAGVVYAALPKPVPVEQAPAARDTFVVTVDEDGKTRVKDRYVVSAPLSGNLARIELRPGDEVKQGDVLARIVPSRAPLLDARSKSQAQAQVAGAAAGIKQVQAQIQRAEAALDYAKKEAIRYRALVKEGAAGQMELDRMLLEERARQAELTSAQFGEKVAKHELRMARAALGHYEAADDDEALTVTSPVNGRVLKVIHESEGVIAAGAPLIELGDPKALEIVVDVLTSDAVAIRPGSPATVEEWGGVPLQAVVRLVEPSAFTRMSALGVEEQRVNAVIDLTVPYETWKELGDGYRVEARVQVYRSEDAVVVPQSALFRSGGSWATFVVEQNIAKLRSVRLGRRNDTNAEVVEGLSVGENVIVHPNDQVVDGVEVELL
jgi:HlyD family secretion protein